MRLIELLMDNQWNGMEIRHERPHIDRIWTTLDQGYRICFHKMHTIGPNTPYYHPHPWEFQTFIIKGQYYTNVGTNITTDDRKKLIQPTVSLRLKLTAGSWYHMDNPLTWHTVEPIDEYVYSVILTKPFAEKWGIPKACDVIQPRIKDYRLAELRAEFITILVNSFPMLTYSQDSLPAFSEPALHTYFS
jgi:hypothetical protein